MDIEKAAENYLKEVGSVDKKDIIAHDFTEGAKWMLEHIKSNRLEQLVMPKDMKDLTDTEKRYLLRLLYNKRREYESINTSLTLWEKLFSIIDKLGGKR